MNSLSIFSLFKRAEDKSFLSFLFYDTTGQVAARLLLTKNAQAVEEMTFNHLCVLCPLCPDKKSGKSSKATSHQRCPQKPEERKVYLL
jgi:hypothetical protein